jgi:hypothetical protein
MGKYNLTSITYPPYKDKHLGTGDHKYSEWLVQPWTVALDVNTPLGFEKVECAFTTMLFSTDTSDAPNWFGVSYRAGIEKFDSVIIFCHPSPGFAKMDDATYLAKSGEWPSLYRYMQNLGCQLSAAKSDHILIMPYFNDATYGSTGIFGNNWKDIVVQILTDVRAHALRQPVVDSVVLKDVVLSCFSRGRQLLSAIRAKSIGLESYLREIWDFDGVGGAPPYTTGTVRGIIYDQLISNDPRSYHVPLQRWSRFWQRVTDPHGYIPDKLMWHAASWNRGWMEREGMR